MSDKSWKGFERRLCRDMGTERIPVTGERHGADGQTERFSLQFKLRRSLPRWLFAWLESITTTAGKTSRIGVLVLKIPRMRDDDALVVLRWADWLRVQHGEAEKDSGHAA